MSDLRESLLSYSSPSSSNHHAVLLPDTQLTPHHLTPPPSRPSLLLSLLTTHRRALILTLSLLSILTLSIAIVLLSSSIPSPTPHPACSSLYHYACADLLSHTTLQPNQSVAGPSNDVSYAIIATLNSILTTPTRGSPLLHTLYSSCMDTARIERLGVQPLTPYLQLLSNSTGWPAFMHALGRMRADFSLSLVLQATLRVNPFDTREGYLQLLPATSPATGLTYSRADYANATLMQLFRAAAESLFLRAGFPSQDSAQRAADAVDGERLLVDLANRTAATTVPWRPTSSINSTFPFDAYMRGAGMPSGVSRFTVPFLAFYDLLASSYPKGPPAQMVAYAQWRLLTVMAPFLSSDVQAAVVAASLTRREVDTRQDSCRRAVNNAESLGDLLGEQFMLERFNGSARTAVRRMFEHVVEAWHGWVGNLTWLSEQDGLAFLAKVDRMQAFVGGSRRLSAYANLTLDPSAYFDNLRLLRRLHNEYVWTGLVGVYEPERYWQGKPATVVDAAYKYEYNAQYLYAGFFQAAEFWAGEEDDVSAVADVIGHFAYTGDIIGHELGHGFDPTGLSYNAAGSYSYQPWLTPASLAEFNSRLPCLERKYDALLIDGQHVEGKQTLTENIADSIGLRLAWLAYVAWKARQPTPPLPSVDSIPLVDTADQYFFTRWAQKRCVLYSQPLLASILRDDPHAPWPARVNGPAQMFEPFADAFNCPKGHSLTITSRMSRHR